MFLLKKLMILIRLSIYLHPLMIVMLRMKNLRLKSIKRLILLILRKHLKKLRVKLKIDLVN